MFALPSWFETPGLAALEAALAGCSVVITPFGSTREYFGDLVEYARPAPAWRDQPGPGEMLGGWSAIPIWRAGSSLDTSGRGWPG